MRAWHRRDLRDVLRVGYPDRVHEQHYALGGAFGWINILLASGVGWVPEPGDPQAWQSQVTTGISDGSTGRALPTDHLPDE